jgi:hypothetical protein
VEPEMGNKSIGEDENKPTGEGKQKIPLPLCLTPNGHGPVSPHLLPILPRVKNRTQSGEAAKPSPLASPDQTPRAHSKHSPVRLPILAGASPHYPPPRISPATAMDESSSAAAAATAMDESSAAAATDEEAPKEDPQTLARW